PLPLKLPLSPPNQFLLKGRPPRQKLSRRKPRRPAKSIKSPLLRRNNWRIGRISLKCLIRNRLNRFQNQGISPRHQRLRLQLQKRTGLRNLKGAGISGQPPFQQSSRPSTTLTRSLRV